VLSEPLGLLSEEEKVSRWELLVLHQGFHNFMSSQGRAMSDEEDASWESDSACSSVATAGSNDDEKFNNDNEG
jgi:hypothetical protein